MFTFQQYSKRYLVGSTAKIRRNCQTLKILHYALQYLVCDMCARQFAVIIIMIIITISCCYCFFVLFFSTYTAVNITGSAALDFYHMRRTAHCNFLIINLITVSSRPINTTRRLCMVAFPLLHSSSEINIHRASAIR